MFDGCRLHKVARSGKWEELLKASREDPSQLMVRNQFHATPFHNAIRYGVPTNILLELMRLAPMVLFMETDEGELPIHIACQFGISVTAMLNMLRQEADLVSKKTKEGYTPLQVARNAKMWGVGLTWHFFRDEYTRVCGILENPAAREAMYAAQKVSGYDPVSYNNPTGKDVWTDADDSDERRENLKGLLTKMDLPDVYMAVPLDPSLRAALSSSQF